MFWRKEETVSMAMYDVLAVTMNSAIHKLEAEVRTIGSALTDARHELQIERDTVALLVSANRTLKAQVAILEKNNDFLLASRTDNVEIKHRMFAKVDELKTDLTAARAEAEANKTDAEKYRRSRANLKQFRKESV